MKNRKGSKQEKNLKKVLTPSGNGYIIKIIKEQGKELLIKIKKTIKVLTIKVKQAIIKTIKKRR